MPHRTDVLIIGAGQAGLAMSCCLTAYGIDHVVLERGRVAERWRSERWDSLRLLTPNWMTRLPGFSYEKPDFDDFMPAGAVWRLLRDYSRQIAAPVRKGISVTGVGACGSGFLVSTDAGHWRVRCVVVATGACDVPAVPSWASALDPAIHQILPNQYRNPGLLPRGRVLVVGASATGVQLAAEIHRSGRPVLLAAGRHARVPRKYRGRDLMEWMDVSGILEEPRHRTVGPARPQPSLQLTGSGQDEIGLPTLASQGVKLLGRAIGGAGHSIGFDDTLGAECNASEGRRRALLSRIDAHIAAARLSAPPDSAAWVPPPALRAEATQINLRSAGIRSVVWATGYRRNYPWLHLPVFDAQGEIRNRGGETDIPGLFVLGLPFMRHRASSFIDGVGRDATSLASAIVRQLAGSTVRAA